MARKNTLLYPIYTAAAPKSMASTFTSPATIVRNLDNCAYQINIITSDSTGTFAIQASNDYAVNDETGLVVNAGNWITLPLSGSPTAAGANDQILINLNQLPFNAIRFAYTASVAGTGTLSAYLVCKQIGG